VSKAVLCDGSDDDGGLHRPVGVTTALFVAVTGGIGAGKSTVSGALAARGAVVIDADQLAREVVGPGTPGLTAVVDAFGPTVLAEDGSLDRAALGSIVFADRAALAHLEGITHPLVRALTAERYAAVPATGVAVNDVPLIRRVSDAARYHLVVGVGIGDQEVRVRRLIDRGHSEADAKARIAAQISDDERRRLADVWIDNSGEVAALEPVIDTLWQRLTTFAARRRGEPVTVRPVVERVSSSSSEMGSTALHNAVGNAALMTARVSAACGGRTPEVSTVVAEDASQMTLTMTVALDDRAELERCRPALAEVGILPTGSDGHSARPAGTEPGSGGARFRSADPGLSLNLYLRVKD
jgi:dephospho-CoA kinase